MVFWYILAFLYILYIFYFWSSEVFYKTPSSSLSAISQKVLLENSRNTNLELNFLGFFVDLRIKFLLRKNQVLQQTNLLSRALRSITNISIITLMCIIVIFFVCEYSYLTFYINNQIVQFLERASLVLFFIITAYITEYIPIHNIWLLLCCFNICLINLFLKLFLFSNFSRIAIFSIFLYSHSSLPSLWYSSISWFVKPWNARGRICLQQYLHQRSVSPISVWHLIQYTALPFNPILSFIHFLNVSWLNLMPRSGNHQFKW